MCIHKQPYTEVNFEMYITVIFVRKLSYLILYFILLKDKINTSYCFVQIGSSIILYMFLLIISSPDNLTTIGYLSFYLILVTSTLFLSLIFFTYVFVKWLKVTPHLLSKVLYGFPRSGL